MSGSFLGLSFGAPAVLFALLLLPVLWWLLRATPPRPNEVSFPPTRLLLELLKREETPSRTPWWLVLIRLVMAALVIVALAQPFLDRGAVAETADGPLVLVLDNGWASAPGWEARRDVAARLVEGAGQDDRPVVFLPSAERTLEPAAVSADEALERLAGLEPRPYPGDRTALAETLSALEGRPASRVVWLSGPVADPDGDAAFLSALEAAAGEAPLTVFRDAGAGLAGVATVENLAEAMRVTVVRGRAGEAEETVLRAVDRRGFVLAEETVAFGPNDLEAEARLDIPTQLRNDVARIGLAGARHAGGTFLLDDRWRRRTVGLVSGTSADLAQPLLSPLHYLRAALDPFVDLEEPGRDLNEAIDQLVDAGTSVIVLADVGTLLPNAQDVLSRWVSNGGVLVRFAGPRTADGIDHLVPVRMRPGTRTLGGNLSWDEPQPLADFREGGPFGTLEVPDDVIVTRQLLAEPGVALQDRTWASLADGTPLVTGRAIGGGWLVFFHVTADTAWSTLPLSGAFVEMLRAVVDLSGTTPTAAGGENGGQEAAAPLPPYRVLDGYGRLTTAGPAVEPLPRDAGDALALGPRRPPGLYGSEDGFRAVNLLPAGGTVAPVDFAPLGADVSYRSYTLEGPMSLKRWFLAGAAGLLLVDGLAILLLMGAFGFGRRAATGAAAVLLGAAGVVGMAAQPALAQSGGGLDPATEFAMKASLDTRLAYVATGDPEIDETSRAGLTGLSVFLTRRTAIEPAEPLAVDLERDELAFFPLLYWPIDADAERPSDEAMAKVDAFMKNGGTILFDTGDQLSGVSSVGANSVSEETMRLRAILDGLDIPPLEPVPPDHVLTKAFYLLQDFPGRFTGSPLWVEALSELDEPGDRPARAGDAVSPIMITGNDFARAWAIGDDGGFLYPTVPPDQYQREMAIRSGINIAIYTMTGNYKADQVHIPALLERLGQ